MQAVIDGPTMRQSQLVLGTLLKADMLLNTFLVEDRTDIRDTLIQAMEEIAPCRFVGHADSESTARQWLHRHDDDWQLVIVDLFLAEGSGFGVLKDCQTRREDQKVVVLTSYSHEHISARCKELGADQVFDKSEELEELVAYCHAHADRLNPHTPPDIPLWTPLQAAPAAPSH